MKVSYTWLQTYFDEKLPTPEELGKLITFYAYEVEGIEKVGSDHIIDIDVLPNRSSDSLSHRGIAREIATILSAPFKDPYVELPTGFTDRTLKSKDTMMLSIEPDSKCRRVMKRLVEDVEVRESPDWLKERLLCLGQRPINNIVDITNYITLFLGQPVHAFDYDKLAGERKEIVIRPAQEGEGLETLDGQQAMLDPSIPVIADSEKALDIAGIKGGANSGIDSKTKRIILSVSNFDPLLVRKASRKLKIQTDASVRFQNEPSAELCAIAMEHFSSLVHELAGGRVSDDVLDVYPAPQKEKKVSVTVEQINGLLGFSLKDSDVEKVFAQFNFDFVNKDGAFTVLVPFERTDINIYEDLIEEVGRIVGYEHLKPAQLSSLETSPALHKEFYYTDRVKNIMVEAGYSEIIGYTFRSSGDMEAIAACASDKSFLRTNLKDGMGEYLEKNQKNTPLLGVEEVRLFEIGRVFPKKGEHISFAFCVSGKKPGRLLEETKTLLEGKLDTTIEGKVSDGIFEVDFAKLLASLPDEVPHYEPFEQNLTQYAPISPYPFVLRDIALWVPSEENEERVHEIVTKHSGDLLVRMTKFDEFEKDGRTSYAYHLVFQSQEKTLTDEEVGEIMEAITSNLNKEAGFEVR